MKKVKKIEEKDKRIAIFGGAFDPPHLGHKRVGVEVVKRGVVDEVWYVPVFEHPWKERLKKDKMASYLDRKTMTEFILPEKAKLKEYKDVSYAYETLNYFQAKNPKSSFSWIIGSEYLVNFGDWHKAKELLNEFVVYVYPRADYPINNLMAGMEALEDFPVIEVSSSLIKDRLKNDEEIDRYLSEEVRSYIAEEGVY